MSEVDWLEKDIYEHAVRANGDKNCPNCGAPIAGEKCPYCGTVFVDFAAMDADAPFFMKIKHKGEIFVLKVVMGSISMHSEPLCLYANNMEVLRMRGPTELDMNFTVVI